jgi:XTP/dITP diphosphohydrolase
MKASSHFEDFVKIIGILRKECPWDREQTHKSLKNDLIEEAYETVDAIDRENVESLKKELGDLLLHVVFHSQIAFEEDSFTIDDVIESIQEKMIFRHPHVFGDAAVENREQVIENWEVLKIQEGRDSVLDGIPAHLPALMTALQLQQKAGIVGFDWQKSPQGQQQVWQKLQEELDEFKEVYKQEKGNSERLSEEFGDILFTLVNIGRLLDLQGEEALRMANKKFQRRFHYIEDQIKESGRTFKEASLEEMEGYWQEAKNIPDKHNS